jgi:hypothetical protein
VIDAAGAEHALSLQFTKTATNTWDLLASVDGGTVTSGATATLTFDATGALVSPTSQSFGLTFGGTGGSTTVDLDLSATRELGAAFTILGYSQNGLAAGEPGAQLDRQRAPGTFGNGQTQPFSCRWRWCSANLLEPIDGTHFTLTDAAAS